MLMVMVVVLVLVMLPAFNESFCFTQIKFNILHVIHDKFTFKYLT